LRVVAGALGGRRLHAPAGGSTRPTADKVREALFSIVGDLAGARVLDLYAGSGALGIEALSRGAAEATFVDRAGPAVAAIRRNLEELGVEGEVHRRDVARFLKSAAGEPPFDLVFCDPPYDSATAAAGVLAERLPPLLTESSLTVTESDKREPLLLPFPLARERTYGDTRLAVHVGS
jgi:16S rRNA (guanine(966)-N(2))-methyltransferase RsmD